MLDQQTLDISKVYEQTIRDGLYVIATPIGNIFDITIRAIAILRQSRYILAEDTRVARKLANFYGIKTRIVLCNEYNELESSVTKYCTNGIVSLISDAGTPLISDPGYRLINWCVQNGVDVFPVPGASSPICGLCVSGMPTNEFFFAGFLPAKQVARIKKLKELKPLNCSVVFLESPNRLVDTLGDIYNELGDRPAYVGRELTKLFEEHIRGNVSDIIKHFSDKTPVGEFVVIIGKRCDTERFDLEEIKSMLSEKMRVMSVKDAVATVKKNTNFSKKELYSIAISVLSERK